MSEKVRFKLPKNVDPLAEELEGQPVEMTYDSNFGGDVTVEGKAEIEEAPYPGAHSHLVVGGRNVRSNRHVFNENERHLGTLESMRVTAPEDDAVDLVTTGMEFDVDRGEDSTVVQMWDRGVMESEGFMEGTDEVTFDKI